MEVHQMMYDLFILGCGINLGITSAISCIVLGRLKSDHLKYELVWYAR